MGIFTQLCPSTVSVSYISSLTVSPDVKAVEEFPRYISAWERLAPISSEISSSEIPVVVFISIAFLLPSSLKSTSIGTFWSLFLDITFNAVIYNSSLVIIGDWFFSNSISYAIVLSSTSKELFSTRNSCTSSDFPSTIVSFSSLLGGTSIWLDEPPNSSDILSSSSVKSTFSPSVLLISEL